MSRIERAVLMGLPALCGVGLAFAAVGPGVRRPVVAARVHAVPVAGATRVASRIQVVRQLRELGGPAPGPVLVVWRDARGELGRGEATVAGEGWCDVVTALERGLPEVSSIEVLRDGVPLGSGEVRARPRLAEVRSAICESLGPGASLTVCVPRGAIVPELPERVVVERRRRPDEPAGELTVEAPGAELAPVGSRDTSCDPTGCVETWAFSVTVRAPTVALELGLRTGERRTAHRSPLPLAPGGLWLDPSRGAGDPLRVRAATPSSRAHLAVATAEGRVFSATVALAENGAGMSEASLAWPASLTPAAAGATVLLATDPAEAGGGVTAWPLDGAVGVEPAPLERVLDAVPGAERREEARVRAVRWPIAGTILTSALAVLTVLALRVRRARLRLEAHLQGHAQPPELARTPLGLGLGLLVALAVAFAVLAFLAARG